MQNSELSASDLLQWERWIEEDPRHRRAFDDVERLSRLTDALRRELADIPLPVDRELAADDYSGTESVGEWLARQPAGTTKVTSIKRRVPKKVVRVLAAAAAVAGLVVLGNALFSAGPRESRIGNPLRTYTTAESEHRVVTLADGSGISIGAKSVISVNYTRERRAVVLERGEALFTVAKNPDRPFVVIAGGGTITAVGTAFNVRHDSERVVVTVTEGAVEFTQRIDKEPQAGTGVPPAPPVEPSFATLVAGEQLTYDNHGFTRVEKTDPAIATTWQSGRLQFRGEPLKYVILGVNRYSDKEIIIVDEPVETFLFTGTVFQNQTGEWLQSLTKVFPVEVVDTGGGKLLLAARADD